MVSYFILGSEDHRESGYEIAQLMAEIMTIIKNNGTLEDLQKINMDKYRTISKAEKSPWTF